MKKPAFIFLLCGILFFAAADDRPTLAVMDFQITGIEAEKANVIVDLVALNLSKTGIFRIIDQKERDIRLKEIEISLNSAEEEDQLQIGKELAAKGLVSGRIAAIGGNFILQVKVIRTETGEQIFLDAKTYSSLDEMIHDNERFVYQLLRLEDDYQNKEVKKEEIEDKQDLLNDAKDDSSDEEAVESALENIPETEELRSPSLQLISGSWKGDKGVREVKIYRNGTGQLVLTNWISVKITINIEGEKVIVTQAEDNFPDLYTTALPYDYAYQLAEKARPMRWIFYLLKDGKTLKGIKETTRFEFNAKGKLILCDNSYTRAANWVR